MKNTVNAIFEDLFNRYDDLSVCKKAIENAFNLLKQCYDNGGKVLVCGNGGSAADSEHIVGELMKSFLLQRKICSRDLTRIKNSFPEDYQYISNELQSALPAISLVSQSAISSAFINDVTADMVFAQQVYGYAKQGDVLLGLSTSGNSKNVINAIKVAKAMDMRTIGLTGAKGGVMKELCDVTICAPADITYKVQEYHLPIYHTLCAMIEYEFFDE